MKITKTTPIYVYEEIAAAAEFWERTFGFKRIVEVPHERKSGFILLSNGEREIMFQSVASAPGRRSGGSRKGETGRSDLVLRRRFNRAGDPAGASR